MRHLEIEEGGKITTHIVFEAAYRSQAPSPSRAPAPPQTDLGPTPRSRARPVAVLLYQRILFSVPSFFMAVRNFLPNSGRFLGGDCPAPERPQVVANPYLHAMAVSGPASGLFPGVFARLRGPRSVVRCSPHYICARP